MTHAITDAHRHHSTQLARTITTPMHWRSSVPIIYLLLGVLALAMLAAGCSSGSSGGSSAGFEPRYAYVLNEADPSVAWYRIDADNNAPRFAGYLYLGDHGADEVDDMVITPDGRYIYVSDPAGSQVHILEADPATGNLSHNGAEDFGNTTTEPGAMAVSPQGEALYIAREQFNPGDNIRAFAIDESDGSLTLGATPNPAILDDLPDDLVASPDGNFLFGTNMANDRIKVFAVDGTNTVERLGGHTLTLPAGAVPQHLAIGPGGEHLYVVSAGGADEHLRAFDIDTDGALTLIDETNVNGQQQVSVTPDGAAIISVSFGGNANVYELNETTDELEFVQQIGAPPGGASLNNVAAVSPDPTGQYLLGLTSGMTEGEAVFMAEAEDIAPEDYLFNFGSISREDPAQVVWATGNQSVEVSSEHLYAGDATDDSETIERFIVAANGDLTAPLPDNTGWEGVAGLSLVPGTDVLFSIRTQGVGSLWALILDPDDGTVIDQGLDSDNLDPPIDVVAGPGGKYVYVAEGSESGAVAGSIRVYEYFEQFNDISFSGGSSLTSKPVAMAMDPSGRALYVARENLDIEHLSLDPDGGFSSEGIAANIGSNIRQMEVTPSGSHLLFGTGQTLHAYEISAVDGGLTQSDTANSGVTAESMISIHPDGTHVYTATSVGGNMNLASYILDPVSGNLAAGEAKQYAGLGGTGSGTLQIRPEGDILYATFQLRDTVRAIPLNEENRHELPELNAISLFDTVANPVSFVIRPVIE